MDHKINRTIWATLLAVGLGAICLTGLFAGDATITTLHPQTDDKDTLAYAARQTEALARGVTIVTNSVTRTNNAVAYAIGDAICPSEATNNLPVVLTGAVRVPGTGGYITRVSAEVNQASMTAGLRVWFYNGTNVTAQADNVAYTSYSTNSFTRINQPVDLSVVQAGTDCTIYSDSVSRIPFQLPTGETNLYFMLQAQGAFTPAASSVFKVIVAVDQR